MPVILSWKLEMISFEFYYLIFQIISMYLIYLFNFVLLLCIFFFFLRGSCIQFSVISHQWNGAGSVNSSSWNITTHLFCISIPWLLAMQAAWASTHYCDVIMTVMPSQITSLTIVYSTVYSSAAQRTHQTSSSLAFVRRIHRWTVNSLHKGPVTRKMFPFDDVIMQKTMWCKPSSGIFWHLGGK